MSFVPPYMGDVKSFVEKGVSFKNQTAPVADLEKSHQVENLKELLDFAAMPVTSKSSVVWDLSVLVKS